MLKVRRMMEEEGLAKDLEQICLKRVMICQNQREQIMVYTDS